MPRLKLDIVTAERSVFSGEVDSVNAPGVEGELGILPRHAPLLTMLQPGDLRVRIGDDVQDIAISGGFLEVLPDHVVVLADTAERADEIDTERAQEALDRARALLRESRPTQPMDLAVALAALRKSETRLKVARKRRQQQP